MKTMQDSGVSNCSPESYANSCSPTRFGFRHPAAAQVLLGDAGQIRLDVEDRRSVEHVNAADVQGLTVATEEFDDGEGDGIGASRGSRREDSVRAVVDGRSAEQLESFGAVEDPEDEEVREAFDVSEAELEFREDCEDALSLVFGAGSFGDVFRFGVRSFGVSDRAW
jgi:hypothetical protein